MTTASKAVRFALEAAHPQNAGEIQHVVAEVATAIQTRAAAASHDFAAAQALVESLQAAGRLAEGDVAMFARAGKFEEAAAALAILCALPIDVVERAMVQDRAETILIIAKANGLSWTTVKAVLGLCAGKHGMSAQELEQNLATFNKLKRETALKVIEFQRKRQTAQPAAHR